VWHTHPTPGFGAGVRRRSFQKRPMCAGEMVVTMPVPTMVRASRSWLPCVTGTPSSSGVHAAPAILCRVCSSGKGAGVPGRGASVSRCVRSRRSLVSRTLPPASVASRSARSAWHSYHRSPHRRTVSRPTASVVATRDVFPTSASSRSIPARCTTRCGLVLARTHSLKRCVWGFVRLSFSIMPLRRPSLMGDVWGAVLEREKALEGASVPAVP
jgi:hypothetical protein